MYELANLQPAFDSDWKVYQYVTDNRSLETPVLPVPEFLRHHLSESINDLLNKTAAIRPTAAETRRIFQLYCEFLRLPVSQLLVNIRSNIPYAQWKQLAATSPSERDILSHIAKFYEGMGEMQVAGVVGRELTFLDLTRVGEKDGNVADLGGSDVNDGNNRTAIQKLERSIEVAPYDIRLWHRLCQAHIINGEENQAIALCKKGIEECPSNPSPFLALSNIYARKGEYDEAMSSFVQHFDGDEISLPLSETTSSSSSLAKTGTLKSLASAFAARGSSDENMTLHLAAWIGNMTIVEKFVQPISDGETLSGDKPSLTPLHLAAWNMHTEVATTLAKSNETWVHTQDDEGWTPLHIAALNGDTELIRFLLEANADPEAQIKSNSGRPMHWAAEGGHADAILALRVKGADISAQDLDGWTPLHWAASRGHVEAMRVLRDAGASVEAMDKEGLMPLHLAAEHGHLQVIKTLAEFGAEVSCSDQDGSTPMHRAARSGDPYVINVLVDIGAEISPRNNNSSTPLHEATKKGHVNAVKVLVEEGADVSACDDKGKTPRDYAKKNKDLLKLIPKSDDTTNNHSASAKQRPDSKRPRKPEDREGNRKRSRR